MNFYAQNITLTQTFVPGFDPQISMTWTSRLDQLSDIIFLHGARILRATAIGTEFSHYSNYRRQVRFWSGHRAGKCISGRVNYSSGRSSTSHSNYRRQVIDNLAHIAQEGISGRVNYSSSRSSTSHWTPAVNRQPGFRREDS